MVEDHTSTMITMLQDLNFDDAYSPFFVNDVELDAVGHYVLLL